MDSTAATLILGVAVALLVVCGSLVLWRGRGEKAMKLPPGPRPWPVVGSLHLLGTRPHSNLAALASQYGPLMSVWLGQRLCIVATSPETAKEFLRLQDANFSARPYFRAAHLILPADLAFQDINPVTRHIRKILTAELTSAKQLESSRYIRTEEMAFLLSRVAGESGPSDLRFHLNVMSSNNISRMIFNKRFLGNENQNDSEMVKEFMEIVAEELVCFSAVHPRDFFNVPKWFDPQGLDKRFCNLRKRMDRFYVSLMDQYKVDQQKKPKKEEPKTVLDVLLDQLDNPECGVTEEHIKCVMWDMLTAGTETSASTTEWAIAEVLSNPKILAKAVSELDRIVTRDRMVQESDLPNFKYIQAIVKEVLRLHPAGPLLLPHQNKTATKAFGYDIPAGTRIFVNVWAIGRMWERPLEFIPERFVEGGTNGGMEFNGQHFEFLPFGSGRRSCPGMGLASIAVHLQVASLLHAFEWEVAAEGLDLAEAQPTFALPLGKPLVVVAKPRLPLHLYQE